MTFIIIGCAVGLFVVEMLGYTYCRTKIQNSTCDGVIMSCEVEGHTYVVHAPSHNRACEAWVAYAADPECNFTYAHAAKMNRLSREFFKCKRMRVK